MHLSGSYQRTRSTASNRLKCSNLASGLLKAGGSKGWVTTVMQQQANTNPEHNPSIPASHLDFALGVLFWLLRPGALPNDKPSTVSTRHKRAFIWDLDTGFNSDCPAQG